jgi:hypothetical protein
MSGYRSLIDHLAGLARDCVLADRIDRCGHAERSNEDALPLAADEARRKAALLAMTADQQAVVAALLRQERAGAIHDVLANLPAFDLMLGGQPLDALADEQPHWDFLARLGAEPWRD